MMTISEIKSMSNRELVKFFSKVNSATLKEVLNNENLGGGISNWKKEMLIDVICDLVEGIESDLVKKLKPKKVRKVKDSNKLELKLATNSNDKVINKETGDTEEERWFNDILKTSTELEENSWCKYEGYLYFCEDDMTEQEAKRIYRRLAKYYHPDNKETGDKEKFIIVKEAWDMIETFKELRNFVDEAANSYGF